MKKGLASIAVYAIFIVLFCYASSRSLWILFFGWVPYVLGGAGIITFIVGHFVQKYSKTASIIGKVMYGILTVLIALGGCIITYGLNDSGGIDWSDVWREDTGYTLTFSFIGVMLGQFLEARKSGEKNKR